MQAGGFVAVQINKYMSLRSARNSFLSLSCSRCGKKWHWHIITALIMWRVIKECIFKFFVGDVAIVVSAVVSLLWGLHPCDLRFSWLIQRRWRRHTHVSDTPPCSSGRASLGLKVLCTSCGHPPNPECPPILQSMQHCDCILDTDCNHNQWCCNDAHARAPI